jgi:hypothetical protein
MDLRIFESERETQTWEVPTLFLELTSKPVWIAKEAAQRRRGLYLTLPPRGYSLHAFVALLARRAVADWPLISPITVYRMKSPCPMQCIHSKAKCTKYLYQKMRARKKNGGYYVS